MTLHKKFSCSELFSSLFSRIQTEYGDLFSPNPRKYGPEKLRIRMLFTQCEIYQGSCHTSQERPLCKDYRSILSNCFQRVAQELLNADSAWKSLIVILKSPTFTCPCYLLILHKYSGKKLGANESATTFRKRFSAFKKCQYSRYPALASLGTQTKNGFEILITKNI